MGKKRREVETENSQLSGVKKSSRIAQQQVYICRTDPEKTKYKLSRKMTLPDRPKTHKLKVRHLYTWITKKWNIEEIYKNEHEKQ